MTAPPAMPTITKTRMSMSKGKALIAMSGGVDSSAAAFLMQEEGWDCRGATMRLFQNADIDRSSEKTCCSLDDVEDARAVAFRMGMPFHVFNFTEEFSKQVIDRFVCAYEQGETPNPCIDCNRYLKFDRFYRRARELGCDCIVTGHYARIEQDASGRWLLKKAVDASKDQSYVLYSLTQDQLAHTRFPLGGFTKAEARDLAERAGFRNARKHDSQDICFVPDGDYAAFIQWRTGKEDQPGNFVLEDGTVLGRHHGMIHYTIGQRKGLGIAYSCPLYVLRKDLVRNEVVLSTNAALFSDHLLAKAFNWISIEQPTEPVHCMAKTRYQAKETPCTATVLADGTVSVQFEEPVRAITPGQAVVLYDGDIVVGGGTICK